MKRAINAWLGTFRFRPDAGVCASPEATTTTMRQTTGTTPVHPPPSAGPGPAIARGYGVRPVRESERLAWENWRRRRGLTLLFRPNNGFACDMPKPFAKQRVK